METYEGNRLFRKLLGAVALALTLGLQGSTAAAAYEDGAANSPRRSEVIYLKQGWTAELRELAYFTPQGSRLMPRRDGLHRSEMHRNDREEPT
jgi:hypothetical protein